MNEQHDDHQATRSRKRDPNFEPLRGDWLCLDFANTVDDRHTDHVVDHLAGYADLVRWGWHAWLLTDTERDRLLAVGEASPEEAAAVFAHAIELREAIYRVFAAIASGSAPPPDDLGTIAAAHVTALRHARLVRDGECFEWVFADEPALDRPLWPIVHSAVELLTSHRLERVKQCPGCDDCNWLFLDTSKNGTRRWCTMEGCGSRAKMRRQYARRKGATT
jgi:predicted RNA-binding Zn ribbon-like protein